MKHSVFWRYVLMGMMGALGLSCYILVDTYFVSQALGSTGLAALNLAIPVYSFIHGAGVMLGVGGGTRFSLAQQKDERNAAFTHTMLMAAAGAAAFAVLGVLGADAITKLLGADEAVYDMTKVYMQTLLLFAPAFLLNEVLLGFVRNDGAPQLSMAGMLGGSLMNIVLDYVFMFPLGMGMFGAVLATCLAPIVSLAIFSPFFLRRRNTFHWQRTRMQGRLCAQILGGGVPSLVTELSSGAVMIAFNSILLRLSGNVGVAAYGVIANLSLVVVSLYTGTAQGVQPLVSSSWGAGDKKAARRTVSRAVRWVCALSAVIYALVFAFAPQVTAVFNSEGSAELAALAERGLRIYFAGCMAVGINVVLASCMAATAHPQPAQAVSLLRGFLLILPLAYLLSAQWGMDGLWAAFPAAEGLTLLAALWLQKRNQ